MQWFGGRESGNVEDRRGSGGLIGGGIGATIIGLVIYLFTGHSPDAPDLPGQQENIINHTFNDEQHANEAAGTYDSLQHFVRVVLAETEDVWDSLFQTMGRQYRKPRLVLFRDQTPSPCGYANAATGPFYCPADEMIYLDGAFFDELKRRFHAPGDFANAYVIAHEAGHHVQRLLGITERVEQLQSHAGRREANRLSVMLELQADFYAGIWAHYTAKSGNVVEPGDIEAALNAANAIGDDRLQQQTQGRIVPDAFTHGTSQQRVHWFRKGYETGDVRQGDTFGNAAM